MIIKLEVEIEYDPEEWHGDDPSATDWFHHLFDVDGGLHLHSDELGDTIGEIVDVKIIDKYEPTIGEVKKARPKR